MMAALTLSFFINGLFLIVIMQTVNYQSCSAALTWKMEPQDVISLQGETVMINCIVSGRNTTRSDQKFWWYKPDRGQYISRNWALYLQEPEANRYTVLLDKHLGVYSLVIRNVSEFDGGQYQCIFRQNDESESFSGLTTLTVLIPPAQGYPKCSAYPKSHLTLSPRGTKALSCPAPTEGALGGQSHRSNLTVYHIWAHDKQHLNAFFLQNKTVLLSEAAPKGTPNSPTLFCALDQPSILGPYPERCELIDRPQKAQVSVTPARARVTYGDNINFTCHSEDVAVVTKYSWYFSNPVPAAGLAILENGQIISIEKLALVDDTIEITCKVNTEWGLMGSATAHVSTFTAENIVAGNDSTADNNGSPADNINSNSSLGADNEHDSLNIAEIVPKENSSSVFRNVGFLIGPGLGVILLFIGAVFLACCIIKYKTKGNSKPRPGSYKNTTPEAHASVPFRTPTRNKNRNSSALSRRFSDSYRFDGNNGPNSQYENFQAITAHQNSTFSRGVTSFQDPHDPNSPLEANVKVHIEMPNLSASLPALNMYKISTNGNNGKDTLKSYHHDEGHSHQFPPPLPLLDPSTDNHVVTKGNSYQDLYVEPTPESPYHRPDASYNSHTAYFEHQHQQQQQHNHQHQHDHHHQQQQNQQPAGQSYDPNVNNTYHHDNGLHNHERPSNMKKGPPPVVPRRKTPSLSVDWANGPAAPNQPLHRI